MLSRLADSSIRRHVTGSLIATSFSALLLIAFAAPAWGQTFQVIHSFTSQLDGSVPWAQLTVDARGNLYGTTIAGGANNNGSVFKVAREGTGWVFSPLYNFNDNDGREPVAPLTIGPDGTLFGITMYGPGPQGSGTVYNVRPPSNFCRGVLCFWTETVLTTFAGLDAGMPGFGAIVFDQAGNGYGTTSEGGTTGIGAVYELTRSQGGWTASVVYSISYPIGRYPYSGLTFDQAGNLYGTTSSSVTGGIGSVYELTPSGSGFTGQILYAFPYQDGITGNTPYGGVILDASGNLYGTTFLGGFSNHGTVYELTQEGGSWMEIVLYDFGPEETDGPINGYNLAMDGAGNLYGTTFAGGGFQYGTVFKLSRSGSGWTYTDLHDFTGGSDGGNPLGGVSIDANGNLFGTASIGGIISSNCSGGCGVVWAITP